MGATSPTIIVLGLFLGASIVIAGVSSAESPRIICTNTALADFTDNVLNDTADVGHIMPAGACPSHFDTSPSDVDMIANADVVVSLGWEPWLEDLLVAAENEDVPRVTCPGLDEWNLPSNALLYVDRIAAGLSATGLFDDGTVNASAARYKAEIEARASELLGLVTANGQVGAQVIAMEWQVAFVEWLGYDVVAHYGPPEGLSTADALAIAEAAQGDDIAAIIDNLQSGTDFGANVASESRATHVIFTNFPGAIPGTETYLDMIRYNAERLIDGVETHEYKRGDIADLEDEVASLEVQRAALAASTGVIALVAVALFIMYRGK
ncbi:MAG: zinc ABC transporter substrate-binding protein [Thermoplasmata archaeon]|nr:zinc ABC transporter substrate-binding protein [Thermoplasmata archaeon]